MKKRTLIVVRASAYGDGTEQVFGDLFDDVICVGHEDTVADDFHTLDENTTVLFEGGTDINPQYYQQLRYSLTDRPDDKRDQHEFALFHRIQKHRGSVIGICRGAQLACVAAGGELIQHVSGHTNSKHLITVKKAGPNKQSVILPAASDHHQMMLPHRIKPGSWEILAWPSEGNRSAKYHGQFGEDAILPPRFVEPEIVWFENARALAIQPHPEWMDVEDVFPHLCRNLVKQYIFGEENA